MAHRYWLCGGSYNSAARAGQRHVYGPGMAQLRKPALQLRRRLLLHSAEPKPEAGNGDGREFQARKGVAVIAIWGEYAQGPSSQREDAALREPECVGGKATYRFSKPTVQVISCMLAKGGILYWYSQQRKDIIVTLEATYPEAEKSTWDPVVQHMIHSIHLSDSEF